MDTTERFFVGIFIGVAVIFAVATCIGAVEWAGTEWPESPENVIGALCALVIILLFGIGSVMIGRRNR